MHTVHRVYIGARNIPSHKFLPNDENRITATLKKYLKGWTTTQSLGYWEGTNEETLILTVVQSPENKTNYGNGLVSAVGEIASFLDQYAIMWESNGTAVIVKTKKTPTPATIVLPAIGSGRKPRVRKSSPVSA